MKLRNRVTYILIASAILLVATALNAEKKGRGASKTKAKKDYCVECHNNLTGKLQAPVSQWRSSVHHKAGISCSECHGGNPGINHKEKSKVARYKYIGYPKRDKVIKTCGRKGCHTLQRFQFEAGPHYKSVQKSGRPGCSTCHGAHSIVKASGDIIKDKACSQCHTAKYAQEIVTSINSIEKGISEVALNIDFLKKNQVEVTSLTKRLERTRQLFRELLHVFSKAKLQTTRKIIELEISNLQNDSGSKVALTERLDLLYLVTALFCVFTIIGFLIYSVRMIYKRKNAADYVE
jgi:hypothetical protein